MTHHDVNDEFAIAFEMKQEQMEEKLNQSNRYFCGEPNFVMNLLNIRNNYDNNEFLEKNENKNEGGIGVDLNEEVVGFGAAGKLNVCEMLELARETKEVNNNKEKK